MNRGGCATAPSGEKLLHHFSSLSENAPAPRTRKEEVRRGEGDDSSETFRRKSFEMMCRCLSPETAGGHNLALVTTIYDAKFDLILLKVNGGSRITLGHFEKENCSSHFHSGRRWLNEESSLELFFANHESCSQQLLLFDSAFVVAKIAQKLHRKWVFYELQKFKSTCHNKISKNLANVAVDLCRR